jgi:endoglucanase
MTQSAHLNRRQFLGTAAAAAVLTAAGIRCAPKEVPDIDHTRLPRWRGFNLMEKFIQTSMNAPFREADFEMMAAWGFDFVRLPMSYWCWSDPNDWRRLDEKYLAEIDEAVEFGRQYGVHVSLNFHRAPGFSVDRSAEEPFNLWLDDEAQEAFAYHWRHFAERYKGIPNRQLSINLVNEPATITTARRELVSEQQYYVAAERAIAAIRGVDPNRLIIADGLFWARDPVPALNDLRVAQSARGYEPMQVTHYQASWVDGAGTWPEPTWPLQQYETAELRWSSEVLQQAYLEKLQRWGIDPKSVWDKERLRLQLVAPWKALEAQGVGIHVGEFGAFSRTPHQVVLAWMEDLLSLWKEAGWGWALWNFRGAFGILDSGRSDVAYEDFRGHKLDRAMLELLQAY